MSEHTSDRQSSAGKALSILLALGDLGFRGGGEVRLVDLVAMTGYPRPTVHRFLNELKLAGFVSQEFSGPYKLGPKIVLLAAQCLGGLDVRRVANPGLQSFSERFGHTVHLGIRDGVEIVYIDKVEPQHGLLVGSTIGQRRPIPVTALGKALLAYSAPTLLAEVGAAGWSSRTPNTLRSLNDLEVQLNTVRELGYAVDDEESDLGLRCAAAPIFNHAGLPIAAISVTTLVSRVARDDLLQLGVELKRVALEITRALGGLAPVWPD